MDVETFRSLFRFSAWANGQMLEAVAPLGQADFLRDLRTSHGSIRDTLTHMVWSEWIWLQRWKGTSPTIVFSPADFPDVEALRRRFDAVHAERSAFLDQLGDDRLGGMVEYTNTRGETWRYLLWQQLLHVVNHSTYHRGQIVTMLRQLGATPRATDLLVYYDRHS